MKERPKEECFHEALRHTVTSAHHINEDLPSIQSCLASGLPIVVAIQIYESFESDSVAKTGMVPMPDTKTEKLEGGHAVCIVGYQNHNKTFIMRNSWSCDWGDKGYFYLPYDYILNKNFTSDLWCISTVSKNAGDD